MTDSLHAHDADRNGQAHDAREADPPDACGDDMSDVGYELDDMRHIYECKGPSASDERWWSAHAGRDAPAEDVSAPMTSPADGAFIDFARKAAANVHTPPFESFAEAVLMEASFARSREDEYGEFLYGQLMWIHHLISLTGAKDPAQLEDRIEVLEETRKSRLYDSAFLDGVQSVQHWRPDDGPRWPH
jgi:hypothetical protein